MGDIARLRVREADVQSFVQPGPKVFAGLDGLELDYLAESDLFGLTGLHDCQNTGAGVPHDRVKISISAPRLDLQLLIALDSRYVHPFDE